MPHRLASAVEPVARQAAQEHSAALAAVCEAACRQSAMIGALVARGVHPAVADQVVRYWQTTGMTISPEISGQIQPSIVRPDIAREAERAALAAAAMTAYRPELAARPEWAQRPEMALWPDYYRPTAVPPIGTAFPSISPIPAISSYPQGIWGQMTAPMPSPLGITDPLIVQ